MPRTGGSSRSSSASGSAALLGAIQGFLIAYVNIPSFVVTLGGLLAFRGLVFDISGGSTQAPDDKAFVVLGGGALGSLGGMLSWALGAFLIAVILAYLTYNRRRRRKFGFPVRPMWSEVLIAIGGSLIVVGGVYVSNAYHWPPGCIQQYAAAHNISPNGLDFEAGVPWPAVILLAVTVAITFLATKRKFGRYVYAIGGNPEAAELGGINTRWTIMRIYILMGFLCAISAAIASAQIDGATNDLGGGYELLVISAAVIGGTSFSGGIGTIPGRILGAIVIYALRYNLQYIGLPSNNQDIIIAIVLVLAVPRSTHSVGDGLPERKGDAEHHPHTTAGAMATSSTGAPLVEMRHINVAFGGVKAVDDVSVALRPGEVVGLVGGNGAGKVNAHAGALRRAPAIRARS